MESKQLSQNSPISYVDSHSKMRILSLWSLNSLISKSLLREALQELAAPWRSGSAQGS